MTRIGLALVVLALAAPVAASEAGCPAELVAPAASATYYEGGSGGACSLPTPPGAFYAAASPAVYGDSEACGRCARVTGPEGGIVVQIVDLCLSEICAGGHLDLLGIEAFDAIANPDLGIVDIAWETVACDVGTSTMQLEFEGSNPYYLKMQVQNHRHGIASVEMRDGELWVAMTRSFDDHFLRQDAGAPYETPFVFRITDVHGQIVETQPIATLANDVPLDAGVQLEPCPEPAAPGAAIAAVVARWLARRRRAAPAARRLADGSAR